MSVVAEVVAVTQKSVTGMYQESHRWLFGEVMQSPAPPTEAHRGGVIQPKASPR